MTVIFFIILGVVAVGGGLGMLALVGYVLWASLWPVRRTRPLRQSPERIVIGPPQARDARKDEGQPFEPIIDHDHSPYDLADIARAIGFEPLPADDLHTLLVIEKLVHRRQSGGGKDSGYTISGARLADAVRRRHQGGVYTICNIEWTETNHVKSGPDIVRQRSQTVVLYDGPESTRFPQFGTQRRTQHLDRILPFLRHFNRKFIQDSRMSDDREFNKALYVATPVPESVRPLLTPPVRALLKQNTDLTVSAEGRVLAVFRAGVCSPCPAWPRSTFLRRSLKILGALRRAEQQTRGERASPLEDQQRAQGATEWWDRGRGQGGVVSRREIDAFLLQPGPRRVPRSIRSAQLGFTGYVFYGMGAFVLLVVGLLAAVLWNAPMDPDERPLAMALLALFACLGLASILITFFLRWGMVRVLRRGHCRSAVIVKLEPTSMVINGQQQYWVTFRYAVDGVWREAEMRATGDTALKANRVLAKGAETRILVNPSDSRSALWPDGLAAD